MYKCSIFPISEDLIATYLLDKRKAAGGKQRQVREGKRSL